MGNITSNPKDLLIQLDQNHRDIEKLNQLFDIYDSDDSNLLAGFESSNAIELISQYLFRTRFLDNSEYDTKLQPITYTFNIGQIRMIVHDSLDTNHDGKISRKEFIHNLQDAFITVDSLSQKKK